MRKRFLIEFFILATFLLEGCSGIITKETDLSSLNRVDDQRYDEFRKKYDEVAAKGVELAKQYVEDKYGDNLKVAKAEPRVAIGFNPGPESVMDEVTVVDNNGYKVVVDTEEETISDNRQSVLIRDDLINQYIVEEGLIEEVAVSGKETTGCYTQYYDGDLIAFFEEEGGLYLNTSIDIVASRVLNSEDEILDYLQQVISKFKSLEDSFEIDRITVYVDLMKPDKYEEFIKRLKKEGALPYSTRSDYRYGSVKISKYGNNEFDVKIELY